MSLMSVWDEEDAAFVGGVRLLLPPYPPPWPPSLWLLIPAFQLSLKVAVTAFHLREDL
jgi:hypothetical protein